MEHLKYFETRKFDNKGRLGVNQDGGYVIALLDGTYDCYISAGVSNEESFSRDFINFYKMPKEHCYAFDGTIKDYPWHYTTGIQYTKKNLGGQETETTTNLKGIINRYNNIFLKIDIDGGEYAWISSLTIDELSRFKQIVIEVHGTTNDEWGGLYRDKMKCYAKLLQTHYIVHAHGNNHGPRLNDIPETMELTYVNKKCFEQPPEFNNVPLPIEGLDFPCNPWKDEYKLHFYPFLKQSPISFDLTKSINSIFHV
jgi:hypothetical protein